MAQAAFAHVTVWIFDLDNTLYPPECRLFDQIDSRMTGFIADRLQVSSTEADRLRRVYWERYGTTLNGLMQEHGLDPHAFLDHVHDIDLAHVSTDPALADAISALPGRKVIHTNGTRRHAERVLAARGLGHAFDALYGIVESGFAPKPAPDAYARIAAADGFDPTRSAMVEDTARNLIEPHAMGMRTVWAETDCPRAAATAEGEHVHFTTNDLTAFLQSLVPPKADTTDAQGAGA